MGAAPRAIRDAFATAKLFGVISPKKENQQGHDACCQPDPGGSEGAGRNVGGDRRGEDIGDVVPDQDRDQESVRVRFDSEKRLGSAAPLLGEGA